jgi:hypothetical protein
LAILLVTALLVGTGVGIALIPGAGDHRDYPQAGPLAPPITSPPVLAPAAPPGAAAAGIDLSGWKLSIPVENDDGDATTVEPAATTAPWLTVTPDGGLGFWAPANGATTPNSTHTRTELNSLTNFTAGQGRHTLSASVTLQQEPTDGRGIIVGQIHGADDMSSVPYVMLRYQQGRVRVAVKQVQDGDDVINYPLLDGVKVGDTFDYTITDTGDGSMAFTATEDGLTHRAVAPVPAAFTGATVRFQAGDYQQADTPGGADDGGRVTFHRLTQQP